MSTFFPTVRAAETFEISSWLFLLTPLVELLRSFYDSWILVGFCFLTNLNQSIFSQAECINTIMPLHHPNEPLVEIVGIEESASGRSCEAHNVCGEALSIDSIVRFRKVQILNGKSFVLVASLQRFFMSLTYFLSTFFANQQVLDGILRTCRVSQEFTFDSPSWLTLKNKKRLQHITCCCHSHSNCDTNGRTCRRSNVDGSSARVVESRSRQH